LLLKYLVLADGAEQNQRDIEFIKTTWGKDLKPGQIVFLRGGGLRSQITHDQVLTVPAPSSSESILEKTLLGIQFMLESFSFDYLVRVNASTYVNHDSLTNFLKNRKIEFGGSPQVLSNGVNAPTTFNFFLSGALLVFSRKSCQLFSKLETSEYAGLPDDVAITLFMRKQRITISRIPRNNLSDTHIFLPMTHIRLKTSHVAHAASFRFPLVHQYYQTKGRIRRIRLWLRIQINELILLKESQDSFLSLMKYRYVRIKSLMVFSYYRFKIFLGSSIKPE
jgi:hypothetical protein